MANRKQTSRSLCSELVRVLYEDGSRQTHSAIANLEEISADTAALLSDDPPAVGAAISFTLKEIDLYGVVESVEHDPILGWFTTLRFDRSSRWNEHRFVPEHFLALCSLGATSPASASQTFPSKVFTRTKHYVTEKKGARQVFPAWRHCNRSLNNSPCELLALPIDRIFSDAHAENSKR